MAERAPDPLHQRVGRAIKKRWRAWLRAFHRDTGYLLVGLTFVYALSGIAINHVQDWNPNFDAGTREYHVDVPLAAAGDDEAVARHVLDELGIEGTVDDAYLVPDTLLEINLTENNHRVNVDLVSGDVTEDYEKPRFFLRVANWLHYNRGKQAWTYVADGYAFLLLFLACSGMFMLRGRKGLIGRGAILVILGAAVPIAYVHFSGGP